MKQFKFFQTQSPDEGSPLFYMPESTGTESPLLRYFDLLFPYYHTRYVVWDRPVRLSEDLVCQIYLQVRNLIESGEVSTYDEIRHLLVGEFFRYTNHEFRVTEDIHNNLVSQI
jgi:hypothetical protein